MKLARALFLAASLLLPATLVATSAHARGDSKSKVTQGTKKGDKKADAKKDGKSDKKDPAKDAASNKKKLDPALAKLEVLARFSTKFKGGEPRTKNIRRIAELMDGVVVQPGRAFSVNQFIGARTEAKGFVLAPSILDLEYTETVGGGVSQFAATLYNALYNAGFPILEHKPHSHYISRYPVGVEATLSWPGPDLMFKNDSDAPLLIRTSFSKDRVSVRVLGKTPGRKVERKKPVELERKAPVTEYIADATLDPSKQVVERPGSPRRSVLVKRIVENPGGKRRVEEDVVVYLSSKRVLRVNPCRLPKSHKEYTGLSCEDARQAIKAAKAKPKKKSKEEHADKAEKPEKVEHTEKADKADKPDKHSKSDKPDKHAKADKAAPAKPEKAAKSDKPKGGKSDKAKPEKAAKPEKTGKSDKAESTKSTEHE